MNKEKFVEIEGIGMVQFVRNRRARNLSIRISREGKVRVTVPGMLALQQAENFVHVKKDWIRSTLSKINKQKSVLKTLGPGDEISINEYLIKIISSNNNDGIFKVKREAKVFYLLLPTLGLEGAELSQEKIREELWKIITLLARELLPERLDYLARKHGLSYKGVRIRKMKSRWGSCSASNQINLSSTLVLLPGHLADYVILHELAHTRYKDHSARFWSFLSELCTDNQSLRKELRQFVLEY